MKIEQNGELPAGTGYGLYVYRFIYLKRCVMKKFKALIGKHYQLLSLNETTDTIPEGMEVYSDLGSDMKIPDFVLVRAADKDEAYKASMAFIEEWKQKHLSGQAGNL